MDRSRCAGESATAAANSRPPIEAVIFAGSDGRLYRLALDGGLPTPITPAFGAAATPRVSPDGKWIAFVHSAENVDGIALVDSAR